ncbi:hypothetical protein AJ80_04484 [Polytolypa hystricis UAMH7299]|uniref:Bromo domain-containing protein n=1 Tax=Polytolypa hystricis (strain UAMH7299) TaxID=1447883 RepID=A0A2B7Y346_POLH7|nr:hypothetical protein AJ80_04484 [Polytolypa hystricis UAMH7299]
MTAKRRAAGASSPDGPAKGQKRRRISTYVPETDENAEKTTELGLQVLEQIKQATDKHGRLIATEFLHPPDRKKHPDYYRAIRLPLSLSIVEERLRKHEYQALTPVESDLRRMVSNAKSYNDKGSTIFSNAERIRKIVASAMPKINPAYKDPDYVPFSTPIPESHEESPEPLISKELSETPEDKEESAAEERSVKTPVLDHETDAAESLTPSFEGDSFEAAQEKIISEMIRMKDESGLEVFHPFLSKPDRNLYKEYYDIIKHPVSLRAILKLVRGTDRRKNSTGMSPFKTWKAFEEEVSYIWRNAREFNEEGSDIVILAGELEEHFYRRLSEARKAVPEPPQASSDVGHTRIKLRMGDTKTPEPAVPKITLRLGDRTEGKTGESPQGGVTIDSESLKRQQAHVKAGSNGAEMPAHSPPQVRQLRDRSGSRARSTSSLQRHSSERVPSSRSLASPVPDRSAIKIEGSTAQKQESAARELESTSLSSGLPNGPVAQAKVLPPSSANGKHHLLPPQSQGPPPYTSTRETSSPQSKLRKPPRDVRKALISNVTISSHPLLNLRQNLRIDIPPSPSSTQQSMAINLPSACRIISISPNVVASSLQRQTQLSVSVAGQKLSPTTVPLRPVNAAGPTYEVPLRAGVTRIDVEMIARPARGIPKISPNQGGEVDYERVTIFANLLKC